MHVHSALEVAVPVSVCVCVPHGNLRNLLLLYANCEFA